MGLSPLERLLSPHYGRLASSPHAGAADRSITWTLIASLKENVSLYKALKNIDLKFSSANLLIRADFGNSAGHCS